MPSLTVIRQTVRNTECKRTSQRLRHEEITVRRKAGITSMVADSVEAGLTAQ